MTMFTTSVMKNAATFAVIYLLLFVLLMRCRRQDNSWRLPNLKASTALRPEVDVKGAAEL